MTAESRRSKQVWSRALKSLAVGLCVFYLGRELAVWLTIHNIHGFFAFLDNAVAGIAAGIVVLLYESLRQRGIDKLRESEERFRLVANAAPVLIWMSGTDKLCNYFNKTWLDFTGRSMEQERGNGWAEGVHPDDLQSCLQTYTQSFDRQENFRMEYRLQRHDGEYRWILDIGVPRFNLEGSFAGYIGVGIDVTDRKRTEETLLRYAAIVESSNESITGLNVNGTFTNWNKGAERLFGYSASEAIGKHVLFLSPDEVRDDTMGLLKRIWQGQPVNNHETVRLRKDGTRVEISLTVSPIIDVEDRIVGTSAIARDITERKRAEEVVARHSAIVESSEDAIISKDLDAVITSWNAGARRIFGYTEEEAVGQPITIIIPPELREDENNVLQKIRAGERVEHYETIRVTKAGKRVDVSLSISPIKDSRGKITGVSKIVRDITERKEAEEALRKSEEQFRLAALAGKMFSYEWDAATDVIVRSADFAKVLDSDEPIETTGQHILARIHPDEREKVVTAIAALTPESPNLQIVYRMVRGDGTYIWVERESRAQFDDHGRMLRITGMVKDVTERKQAEEALSSMTRKLVEAQEQERARIARELHDDINQRLALLAVELEQLRDDPSEVVSRVQVLWKQTIEVSNDIQALSHDLHSPQLEYLGIVGGMKSWCREFGERQGMQIDCSHDVRSTLPAEIGICLFRVLQEALHNAAKHSGVKRIKVQIHEEPDEIQFIVSDLGKGFDVEAVKLGKGLGLISMQERVRLVNGTISIDSKPMGGTTVHVRIPLESEQSSQRQAG